ncbi:hypothetical protein B0T10DRAFT_594986 [Thelonectria olida]|uniref:Uncharacterized protein n=1 Tax=Thelonectria olida TaxID=1576542 RepID=A0A9P8VMR4_9HYPO|nr:hypothetical protein B0T10DRAFT_594986 [Thelonectria olida]
MRLATHPDPPHLLPSAAAYEKTFKDPFVPTASDVFIAVMGMTGAGKSTFISHCTEEEVAISDPGALQSCTREVRVHRCKHFSPLANVYLEIASWFTETYQQKIRLRGILYLHRISDNRMGGCAHRNLSMFKKLCGHEGIKSVIFLTTFWEKVDEGDGDSREQALKTTDNFWGFFVKRGARVRRHQNTPESALSAVQEFVPGHADQPTEEVNLAIQTEMVDSGKNLDQTSAGQELQSEIERAREKLQQGMREREEEMKEAMEARDKEMIEILREEQAKQNEELKRRDMEVQDLKISMERMHEEKILRLEARLLQQQEEHREYLESMARMQQQYQEELQQLRNERIEHESRMDGLSRQIDDLKTTTRLEPKWDSNSGIRRYSQGRQGGQPRFPTFDNIVMAGDEASTKRQPDHWPFKRTEHQRNLYFDDPRNEQLVRVAEYGDEAAVKLLLEQGADVDARTLFDNPLYAAAKAGHWNVAKLLLEKGADIEGKDFWGETALSIAAGAGHEAVVKLLIENGANLSARDSERHTPLWKASTEGYLAVVKVLVKNGATRYEDDIRDLLYEVGTMPGCEDIYELLATHK